MDESIQAKIDLIGQFFPLKINDVSVNNRGEDFSVVEINSEWIFRFPRSDASQMAMKKESSFLSRFNNLSPIKVPNHQYIGNDYTGYPKIHGVPLSTEVFQSLSKEIQVGIAKQLGQFLSALHGFPIMDAVEMGIEKEWNGSHHQAGIFFLKQVSPVLSPAARKNSTACMETILAEEFNDKVIHGDFYLPDHVFYDESSGNLGVIDFADVTIYDPAHDFQCIVEVGGDVFFEHVIDYYQGEIDLNLLKRSRLRLTARPLFVAGRIFAHGLKKHYAAQLARIEAEFG